MKGKRIHNKMWKRSQQALAKRLANRRERRITKQKLKLLQEKE